VQAKIDKCLERTAKEQPFKQMSECIGLIADPCGDADQASTASIVACQERETRIWDAHLNGWFQDARAHLDSQAGPALQAAQRAWVTFRDAKCAMSEKIYEGGSIAAVMVGDCKLVETGRRALEMSAIDIEANDTLFAPR
jgi:uncharacterized protein YecT (DUF1311 family)